MRLSLLPAAAVVLAPSLALAHINIRSPVGRTADQKEQHCGQTVNTRANVYTALPGSTLRLTWAETINHPGYYRVSFQQDGSVFRIPPAVGVGGFPTENLTGMTDPGGSGSLILADRIADGTLSLDVVLPNVECTNCTLQLIQLMTDKPPYTVDALSDDIYFQCLDLVLSTTAPPPVDAAINPGDPDAGTDGGSNVSGGCSTSGASSGLGAALLGLGLATGMTRRRRAR